MKEIYDWVPWFRELAEKIADGGERDLIDKAKRVAWSDNDKAPPLLRYGDDNIDPLSFFYTAKRVAWRLEQRLDNDKVAAGFRRATCGYSTCGAALWCDFEGRHQHRSPFPSFGVLT